MLKFIRRGPPKYLVSEGTATGGGDVRPTTDIDLIRARVAEVASEIRDTMSHLFHSGPDVIEEPVEGSGPGAVLVAAAEAAEAEQAAAIAAGDVLPSSAAVDVVAAASAAVGDITPAVKAASRRSYCELM